MKAKWRVGVLGPFLAGCVGVIESASPVVGNGDGGVVNPNDPDAPPGVTRDAPGRIDARPGAPGPDAPSGVPGPDAPIGVPGPDAPVVILPPPTGYLLLDETRLAAVRAGVAASSPEWMSLKKIVDTYLSEANLADNGVLNVALVGFLTGDPKYCAAAAAATTAQMATFDVRGDSYLLFPDAMRPVAFTLSWCATQLSTAERQAYAAYLDQWTDELWYHNMGSGWGLHDPGNNYHMAFLEGTAYAAYALLGESHPNAQKYIDLLASDLEAANGVLAYLGTRAAGGGWLEGTNYGERSKTRLGDALAVIAAGGGKSYFTESPFFSEEILYGVYQVQPGNLYLYPAGDMSRESNPKANPDERIYMQTSVAHIAESDARALGRWYLATVVPSYIDAPDYTLRQGVFRDLLYRNEGASKPETDFPVAYWAQGTGFVSTRSGWDSHATDLVVSGSPILDQSHDHLDVGSFTLWRDGWQAIDAVTYSASGLLQEPSAHNEINVAGTKILGKVVTGGMRHFVDDPAFSYAQVDSTGMYLGTGGALMSEVTRELVFLKPGTLVIYDRTRPVSSGTAVTWRLHTPLQPTVAGQGATATHEGGGLALAVLAGSAPTAAQDSDIQSTAWRLEVTSPDGRFLAVVAVASGGPPGLAASRVTTSGDAEGAAVGSDVVIFSKLNFGQAPGAFSYSLPSISGRTHTIVDLSGSYGIQVTANGGTTSVTVSPGGGTAASADGILRFTE